MDSLVSIILPVYNGQKFLDSAIKSILSQSYENLELIIINDASTDKSSEIIENYSRIDQRVNVIDNEVNRNLPNCLNIGHSKARSEFLTWTSDDNILKPDFLKTMVDVIKNEPCDIVYSNYDIINEVGDFKRQQLCLPVSHILFGNVIGASFLYKRKVYEYLKGYDKDLHGVEDYDFWLRASLSFTFYQIHDNLYKYRQHSDSLTKQLNTDLKKRKVFQENNRKSIHNILNQLNFNQETKFLIHSLNVNEKIDLTFYRENFKAIQKDFLKFENSLKTIGHLEKLESLNRKMRSSLLNDSRVLTLNDLLWFLKYQRGVFFSRYYSRKSTLYLLKLFFNRT
ncbi:glycosyltransferase family 2 protein [Leeuwenhoekiella sp. CH_XMU1409-2]|uniref:glycosyltransferase family 2 protein n=1 Tax=Leeuwenhoekiella sp. CH_XMU1409-2 TaxID=3107768 RepID=UPI003009CAC8